MKLTSFAVVAIVVLGCKGRGQNSVIKTAYTDTNPWSTKDTYYAEGNNFYRRACPGYSSTATDCTIAGPIIDLKSAMEELYRTKLASAQAIIDQTNPPPRLEELKRSQLALKNTQERVPLIDALIAKVQSKDPAVIDYSYGFRGKTGVKPNPEADIMVDVAKEFNRRFPESNPNYWTDPETRVTWFYYAPDIKASEMNSVCPKGFSGASALNFGKTEAATDQTIIRLHGIFEPGSEFFSAWYTGHSRKIEGRPVTHFISAQSRGGVFFYSSF